MKRIFFVNCLAGCLLLSLTSTASGQYLSQISSFSTVVNNDVAIDSAGNAYVTGAISGSTDFHPSGTTATENFSLSSIGLKDIFIAKYSDTGEPLWGFSIGGIAGGPGLDDEGVAIAVSPAGNVFVTGYFQGTADFDPGDGVAEVTSNGFRDVFMASYTADGNFRWARGFGGTADDRGHDVGLHENNAVFFTGFFRETGTLSSGQDALTSAGEEDGFLISMDQDAGLNWLFNYGDFSVDKGNRVAADGAGNVYLLGVFSRDASFDPAGSADPLSSLSGSQDGVLASYTPAGDFRWAIPIGGALLDGTTGLAVDAEGHAYLTGFFLGSVDFAPRNGPVERTSIGRDIYIARYTSTGTLDWVHPLGSGFAEGSNIDVNDNGDVLFSGFFTGEIFPNPLSTLRLTSNGEQDILLASYNADGTFQWATNVGGPLAEIPSGVAVSPNGDAYLAGYFEDEVDFDAGLDTLLIASAGSFDGFVAQFTPSGSISVANEPIPTLAGAELHAYPNPAANRVNLKVTSARTGAGHVEIVDVLGRVVVRRGYTGWAGVSQTLDLPVAQLPAGVYMVRLDNQPSRVLSLTIAR